MSNALESIALVLIVVLYISLPILTIWGWTRWATHSRTHDLPAMLSVIGFAFGTASIVLAIGSLVYAHAVRSFPFYDPLLLRIYGTGSTFSLLGILFSLVGVWRPNPIRWHAALCSAGTLLFWVFSAIGE